MTLESILPALTLGLLASTSPCILPLYPGYLAYLSAGQGQGFRGRYFLGFFVLGGVMVMMVALGLVINLLSISTGRALSVLIPIADLLIIGLGVLLLLNINPFKRLPQIGIPGMRHPFSNAFVYGLLYGPIALPCSGPLLVGIFAFSLTAGELAGKLGVFLWFGLGLGLPLLLLSLASGAAQRRITRLSGEYSRQVNLVGGLLLVAVGVYDLVQNWELVMAFLEISGVLRGDGSPT
jgi:cytochrome c-type biogenesis protein